MVEIIYIVPPATKECSEVLCDKFNTWLKRASPKETFCYFRGDFVAGKLVGRLAFSAYERGEVTLFQKKEGGKFAYWAVKRK